jgi:hypothetical protein
MPVASALPPAVFVPAARIGALRGALAAAVLVLGGLQAARAETPGSIGSDRIVLELFTSQGCSSCPPADALLGTYAARPDVIALTVAVDYWDYLGWKDTLASPVHSKRQRAYAKRRGDGMVYTPQIVVHGRHHVNGARATDIDAAIEAVRTDTPQAPVALAVKQEGGGVLVELAARASDASRPRARGEGDRKATVWLALVERKVEVPIRSGENRGKRITYFNVVRSLQPIGTWEGESRSWRLERAALAGAQAIVVLVQAGTGGPVLAATEFTVARRADPLLADEKR